MIILLIMLVLILIVIIKKILVVISVVSFVLCMELFFLEDVFCFVSEGRLVWF